MSYVRTGFAQLDAGEIDEFEFDHLIHHYKRSVANYGSSAKVAEIRLFISVNFCSSPA